MRRLALDRWFWATFERQVGPGPAVLGTFERQDGPGTAVSRTLGRQAGPGTTVVGALARQVGPGLASWTQNRALEFRQLRGLWPEFCIYIYIYIYICMYICIYLYTQIAKVKKV